MAKSAKRLFIVLFSAVLMLVGFALAACGGDEQEEPKPSAEQGEYYYDAGSGEYSLELSLGNLFTMNMGQGDVTGKYTLDGELLTLLAEGGETYSATYHSDIVTLTVGDESYRFLRKIEFTVTFDTAGGSTVPAAKVINGKTVEKPTDPQNGERVFVGWYTDNQTFKNEFSFTQPITADLTLYARFVDRLDPEFPVELNVNYPEGENLPTQTTVGHKLFGLPTPARDGFTFVGWWMSDYDSAEKLTAQYEEQLIEEPKTLFAVWQSDAPAVSVSESGVVWQGRAGNNSYTVTITGPDGQALVENRTVAVANFPYDFTSAAEGDYIVSVTMNGQTTTAYYQNRGLARVSSFKVEGSTLLFNAVSHATNYLLTVDCGSPDHDHGTIDLGTETKFDFSECDMKENGIAFTVKATAEHYIESSAEFVFKRTLDAVTGLTVDGNTDVVSWNEVEHALSYFVTVLVDGESAYSGNIGGEHTFDLQYYQKGEITFSVTPVAFGWTSPGAVTQTYAKTRLATPSNLRLIASSVEWDAVDGAQGYSVTLDGQTYSASDNSFELTEDRYDDSKPTHALTVRALGATEAENSFESPSFPIRSGEMGEFTYSAGKVTWDAVFGVKSYLVKLNEGEPQQVTGATEFAVTFTQKGENTIYVCVFDPSVTAPAPEWKSVTVTVYEIDFDAQNGVEIPPVYRAKGDPLDLPDTTRTGYKFSGWYTEVGENGRPFEGNFNDEYDRTAYARWTANEYTVTFDVGQYGEGTLEAKTVTFGSPFELPVPETSEVTYAFRGWYDSTGIAYTNHLGKSVGDFLNAGDIKLTASWVPIFEFEKDANGAWSVSKGQGIGYVTEITIPVMYRNGLVKQVLDFSNCSLIKTVNIPDTIDNIVFGSTDAAFIGCDALENINIYSTEMTAEPKYYSVDGVLFYYNAAADGGRMELKCYPSGRQALEYTIPGVIEAKGGEEYYYVSTIPQGAFRADDYSDCPLKTLNIPSTVSLIEELAFFKFYNLSTVNFLPVAANEKEASGLVIRQNAFGDPGTSLSVSKITFIHFPKRLSENPRDALSGLSYLGYLEVEEGGTFSAIDGLLVQNSQYGKELVFYPVNRSADENGDIIKDPEALGKTTTNRVKEFTIPEDIYAIGDNAVKNNGTIKKVTIPGTVVHIGVSAFQGLTSLENIEFLGEKDDNDLVIEESAFLGEHWQANSSTPTFSNKVSTLTLPANLTKLGQYAFGALGGYGVNSANALHEVTVNVAREKVDFAADAFSGTRPGNGWSVSYVTTLNLGAEVPCFELLNVFGPNIKTINVDPANPNYWEDEYGVLYEGDKQSLIFYPFDKEGPYVIPETVTKIQKGMFQDRIGLTEITIHAGVIEIAESAFEGCTALTTVKFDLGEGEPLTIGLKAFNGCKLLQSVTLPDRLTFIGTAAFGDCDSLISITIPKNVNSLQMDSTYGNLTVFDQCDNLKEINVAPENIYYRFVDGVLYSLREVKLTADATDTTYVPDTAIYVPSGAEGEIKVSGYIHSVGPLAFSRQSQTDSKDLKFTKVTFADAIETFDPVTGESQGTEINFDTYGSSSSKTPFSYLSALTEIHFPKGMRTMPAYLVNGCTKMDKLNVPCTVTSIAPTSFYSCYNLTQLIFDEGGEEGLRIEDAVETPGHDGPTTYISLFGQLKNLTTINFPARLSYLGSYAFYYVGGEHGSTQTSYVQNITFAEKQTQTLTIAKNAFANTKSLVSIKLPQEGLEEIPERAFYYSNLATIDLPDCVKVIGKQAFYYSKLAEITFKQGITEIGESAFASTKLTSLVLPEGLQTIGNSAFNTGTLEGELIIPASVTTIGNSAFQAAKFTQVSTLENNLLASIGSSAFSSNTALTKFVFGKTNTPLTFGANVFAGCSALTSFEFPANVKEIGSSIFANLTNLSAITFAAGTSQLEKVGDTAFSKTSISTISFPESSATGGISLGANLFKSCTLFTSMNLSASIASIDGVLGGCASIKTITIDPNNKYLEADPTLPIIYAKTDDGQRGAIKMVYGELSGENSTFKIAGGSEIGAGAFANQTELEVVYIPASVRIIGNYAFQNCVNLKQVILADDSLLESIGTGAFQNCWKLESINLEKATHLREFGDGNYGSSVSASYNGVFMYAGIQSEQPLKITFPASVTKVGKYMFTNSGAVEIDMSAATQLKEIPAGSYSTSSGGAYYGFFSGSKKLTSVKLPASITFIGASAFGDCTALGSLDFSNLTSLKYLGTTVDKAPSSSSYNMYVFARCTSLTSITFPDTVESVGGRMFVGCENLATIKGLENAQFPAGYAYTGSGLTNATVGSKPCKYMFSDCLKLTSVTFTDPTVSTLVEYMFQNCTALQKVDLSSLTSLTALPNYMFQNCSALEEVTLPAGTALKHLGTYTFQNCVALKKINSTEEGTVDLSGLTGLDRISTSATASVGSSTNAYTFDGCESIQKVVFPEKFTLIGGYAFRNCTNLTTIDFSKITIIGQYAFAGSGLTAVTISASVTNIYAGAFTDCLSLKDVTFAEGTGTVTLAAGTSTKPGVFGGSAVENVTFSGRLTNLNTSTFMNCPSLQKIVLPETITSLGGYQFSGCTALQSVDLSALTIKAFPSNLFDGCINLNEVKLGSALNYLGTYTFRNCSALETIDISMTKVDRFSTSATAAVSTTTSVYLFAGCTSLREVKTNPGQIKQIGAYTFQDCESLTSFDLTGVERLSAYAFYNAGLTGTVTLPSTLSYFYMSGAISPFRGCGKVVAYAIDGGTSLSVHTASSTVQQLMVEEGALILVDANEVPTLVATPGGATFENDTADLSEQEGLKLSAYAFENVTNIKKVILPDDLTELPTYLFSNSSVEEVVLPKNLTAIPNYAFANSALKTIVIPASVTSIGENAFAGTKQLTSVTFLDPEEGTEPQALTFAAGGTGVNAEKGVFYASGIATIVLPDRLTDVPTGTFMNTPNLKSVTFPSGMTKINNYMFCRSGIDSLQLNDNITEIGNDVYAYTVNLPAELKPEDFKNVTTIGSYAFEYATGIKNVTFADSVVSTGMYLFKASSVENVVFPGTATAIGNYMFDGCESLNSVVIQDTAEGVEREVKLSGTFRNSSLKTAVIGEGVVEVGSGTFLECTNLTSVKLPVSLKNIGNQAFQNCTNVKELVIYDSIESIGCGSSITTPGAFSGWTKEQTIYFTASRSYISALVGWDWYDNAAYRLETNVVFNYVPSATSPETPETPETPAPDASDKSDASDTSDTPAA